MAWVWITLKLSRRIVRVSLVPGVVLYLNLLSLFLFFLLKLKIGFGNSETPSICKRTLNYFCQPPVIQIHIPRGFRNPDPKGTKIKKLISTIRGIGQISFWKTDPIVNFRIFEHSNDQFMENSSKIERLVQKLIFREFHRTIFGKLIQIRSSFP